MLKISTFNNNILKIVVLILTFFLAAFLRLHKLASVPPSPSLDEVSIGYNAYSILRTGADEYGYRFPLILRAYDDWRPALYVYLVAPFIQIFGLNVLSVRLPSILLSLVTIFLTYRLIRLITSEDIAPLVGLLILAISPWHIYISRLGHEVNLGLTLLVAGVYFFVRATKNSNWNLLLSAIFFGLSFYSYQSQKVVVPLLLIFLGVIYWNFLITNWKKSLVSLIVGAAITLPIFLATITSPGLIRLSATSAFGEGGSPIEIFSKNYLSHFDPKWLFFGGAREAHKVPFLGLLYPWEALFIVIGLITLRRAAIDPRLKFFLSAWLLTSPLPAAITTQAPHAMRSFTFLPVWQIFSGLGFLSIYKEFNNVFLKISLIATVLIFSWWGLGKFYPNYFEVFPRTQSDSFQYALAQAIPYVIQHGDEYEKIVFSNQKNLYQSYMFFLFYSKYDPVFYQLQGGTSSGGFAETHAFDKYEFRPINWLSEVHDGSTLYVGNPQDLPHAEVKFVYLDGSEGVRLASK